MEIPGVEYVYSTSSPGSSFAIVRFKVGEDEEKSIVKLYNKMYANFDLIPPGASTAPHQAPLHRRRADPRADALERPRGRLHAAPDRGADRRSDQGHPRRLRDPAHRRRATTGAGPPRPGAAGRLPARAGDGGGRPHRDEPRDCGPAASAATTARSSWTPRASWSAPTTWGAWSSGPRTGGRCTCAMSPASWTGRRSRARTSSSASAGGPPGARASPRTGPGRRQDYPAVTISVAKRKGTNAIVIADKVLAKVESLKGVLIPREVQVVRHPQLRRDGAGEVQRTPEAPHPGDGLGGHPDCRCSWAGAPPSWS